MIESARKLLRAMLRELGYSRESVDLRLRGFELLAEMERRGLTMEVLPFPTFTISIPTPYVRSPLE